jgi:hypothetical protein
LFLLFYYVKIEEREREKLKEESEANAKRRKVKRSTSTEPGEYSLAVSSSHSYDTAGERKGAGTPHGGGHGDENARTHSKDTSSKANRRGTEQYPLLSFCSFNLSDTVLVLVSVLYCVNYTD